MDQKRLNEITQTLLIDASQVAYLEGAPKTLHLLQHYTSFFRYAIRKSGMEEPLLNELKALIDYTKIVMIHYNNAFNISVLFDGSKCSSVFIDKLKVIDIFDKAFSSLIQEYTSDFEVIVCFELYTTLKKMEIKCTKGGSIKSFGYEI